MPGPALPHLLKNSDLQAGKWFGSIAPSPRIPLSHSLMAGLPIQILAWGRGPKGGGQESDGGDWHVIRDKINGTKKSSLSL